MKYKTVIGRIVELTDERKQHIIQEHPELEDYLSKIKGVLIKPDEIRKSKTDHKVLLFYRFFAKIKSGLYITVVIKINQRNFILTTHMTDRIKMGEKYEIPEK